MFIYGSKIVRQRLGYVADFCPLCRGFRRHKLIRIGRAGHVYFVSVGSGQLVGHEIKCTQCDVSREADAGWYQSVCENPTAPLEELLAKTRPTVCDEYAERVEMELRVRTRRLSSEERRELVREAFVAINHDVERRASSMHFDRTAALGVVVTLAVVAALSAAGDLFQVSDDLYVWTILGALGAGIVATLILIGTDASRFIRRRLLPLVAGALRPLDPSEQELEAVLADLKSLKLAVGKRVKARDVYAALQQRALLDGMMPSTQPSA